MTEKHIIKILVEVRSVKLLVRFPCKLTFQIKTQTTQTESRNSYDLKKGECIVNQTFQAECEILFDSINGQYQDKKVKLIIQMASTNGIIPAGTVSFNPCNKQYHQKVQYTLPLQKCPDRSAQITFFQSFQLTRKNHPETIYQSQLADKSSNLFNKDLKHSSTSNIVLNKIPRDASNNSKVRNQGNGNGSSNARVSPLNQQRLKTQQQPHQLKASGNYRHASTYQPVQPIYTEFHQSQVVHEEQINYGYSRNPSKHLQPQEKAAYLKEISKLKSEIKSLQSQQRWDQVIRIKEQNETLGIELQKAKERIRMLQRKERQVHIQLKQSKEQGQRTKSKFLQSQAMKNEFESNVNDKEKMMKEYQSEIKRFQEKIQDLNVQISNQQKRIQFKENSYQEQLKKLNEKYTQSQNERQKITFDYNNLLAKLQQAEKKHQVAAKQKERTYSEQKNKLNKKIDQLSQSLEKLKEEHADKQSLLSESLNSLKILQKKDSQRQQKISNLQSQFQITKSLLKKQVEQRKAYEKQIQELKLVQEERNSLRKKNNELSSELSKLNEKYQRISADFNSSDSKNRELQVLIVDKNKERESINNKFNALKKQHESLKREQEKRMRQQQTLSAQNFNAGQKINDLKSKLDTQKRDNQERISYYEEQVAYLSKGREYCQHQIEELKWSLQKNIQQNEDLANRLKQSNQQIMNLNEEILISQEKVKRAEEEKKDSSSKAQDLKRQVHQLQQKTRLLNEQLKNKEQTNYESVKKIQNFESEHFVLKEKLKQLETAYEQRKNSDLKSLKERQKAVSHKSEEITQLQLQIMGMKEQISSSTQEITMRNNEINYLKDNIQNYKQQLASKQQNLTETTKELTAKIQTIQSSRRQSEVLKRCLEEQKKSWAKVKKEWQDYRKETTKALQKLMEQIFKDEQSGFTSVKYNLNTFPDATLSAMQVQALKKRNAILSKYQHRIAEMQEDKAVLQGQIKKLQKSLNEKEQEYQSSLALQKQKLKQFSQQFSYQIQELQKKVQISEDRSVNVSGQLQKANNEIKKKEEMVEELRDNYNSLCQQKQILRSQLKEYQQKLLHLKSEEIKWKANNDIKLSELTGNNDSIIQRLKGTNAELQKKIFTQEKMIKERQQNIRRLQGRLAQVIVDKEKTETKNEQLQEKTNLLQEEKKQLEKKIKGNEKQMKELNILLSNTKDNYSNEKIKLEEVQSKFVQNYNILTESQVEGQKLKAEIQINRQQIVELQNNLRERTDKSKVTIDKHVNQLKTLKEKIINLNSSIELKDFQIKQQEDQLHSFKETINETKQENIKKKAELIKLSDKVQQYKNQEMYNHQNIEILKSQKQFLQEQNDRLKERLNCIEDQLNIAHVEIQAGEMKEKEYLKLREQFEMVKMQKQKLLLEMRNSISGGRSNGLITNRLSSLGGDQKKRIRQLQQLLQSKHIDLSIQRKKLLNEFDREKRQIIMENNELNEQISNLQNQFDFQRVQLQKQIQSLGQQIRILEVEVSERSKVISAQELVIKAVNLNQGNAQLKEYIQKIKKVFSSIESAKFMSQEREEYYQRQEQVVQQAQS